MTHQSTVLTIAITSQKVVSMVCEISFPPSIDTLEQLSALNGIDYRQSVEHNRIIWTQGLNESCILWCVCESSYPLMRLSKPNALP